ncbi:hypothetical protein MTO96_023028 [Rhipicephalus appendiculatus]
MLFSYLTAWPRLLSLLRPFNAAVVSHHLRAHLQSSTDIHKDIENNYRLTAVDYTGLIDEEAVSDWLAVKASTWRNCGLVARAAQIKQASHMDRYVTRAVDRVSRYPALLDEVARSAKLDQAELAVLVRDRLREIRSIDGFMRIAGVVKERVICHSTDDGRAQLDDLNENCWSHVLRYLSTDDVKYSVVHVNNGW